MHLQQLLQDMNIDVDTFPGGELEVRSPIDGKIISTVKAHSTHEVSEVIQLATEASQNWKLVPAPVRGELIRQFGNTLRQHKAALGRLVTLECGKIYQEGLGEVQEMIDICDFAQGLSRQLYGLTIVSERPGHKMLELWQPLGPVGIISAFNFPVAVWAWNAALAVICGNSIIWKPSEKTPITALVCQELFIRTCKQFEQAPDYLSQVIIGDATIGEQLVNDRRVPLISATGSCAMGKKVGTAVASRFGKSILELGGNNAVIVAPSADIDMAVRAIVFGAVGTAGQRCTTTRRLFLHASIYHDVISKLKKAYQSISIGNPLDENNLVGPLIDKQSYDAMQAAILKAEAVGGKVTGGKRVNQESFEHAYYVEPCLIEMPEAEKTIQTETFAPLLYIYPYTDLECAVALQNDVPQGLSSSIFTNDIRESELFISAMGSDCGIANINIGTSGAEIGGAFGGEKETGGGRESGSDAWKNYMRRMTSTTNYSRDLPLAQGIKFDL